MSAARVCDLLSVADRLPDHLREWLVNGFLGWQQGRPLEVALGLNESAPAMSLSERDDLIRASVRLAPGDSETSQAAYFLEVVAGRRRHPDATGREFVRLLQRSRLYIPSTLRHLRRILQGRRCDGWRQRDILPVVSLACASENRTTITRQETAHNGK